MYCFFTILFLFQFVSVPFVSVQSIKKMAKINKISIQSSSLLSELPETKLLLPIDLHQNINQIQYEKDLQNEMKKLLLITGPPGTGKTMYACIKAVEYLKNPHETIKKIVITRPLIAVENEELGFLPGNIESKMSPWTTPIIDYFYEHFTKKELANMLNENKIEICPLAFMRGRTFKNCFIIADEMQNSTPNQMKMLVTRIGTHSRMVITGDLGQSDLKGKNGLWDIQTKLHGVQDEEISCITFQSTDISRSSIVKKLYSFYEEIEKPMIEMDKIEKEKEKNKVNANANLEYPKSKWEL